MSTVALVGVIDASRRRTGVPVVLGYNTKGATTDASFAGRLRASVCTLAAASTLNELHGWFVGATACRYILCLYADDGSASPGAPGTRVAYTSPLTVTSGDTHLSQTGFSVALAAGKYWIGYDCESTVAGTSAYWDIGLSFPPYYSKGINSGAAFNPPPDPFGTPGVNNSGRVLSCWAVVV